jgi:glycosyltransferase involved in cell wall biosynthesis
MIQENDIGYCFDEFDYDGIEQFISSLSSDNIMDFQTKGIKARKLAEKKYSKEIILNRFKELI